MEHIIACNLAWLREKICSIDIYYQWAIVFFDIPPVLPIY